MVREIAPCDIAYNLDKFTIVDIRSPSEYKEFHIPGAENIPLFNDEEKRFIGEIYRIKGQEVAKEEGLKIVSPKLYKFYKDFKALREKGKPIVVYCWRGGMRSLAMCSFLAGTGIEVFRLKGGFRAFRQFILKETEKMLEDKNFVVITGKTGVGKTRILRMLKEQGLPVIDLEYLAKDRGSAFGKVGIKEYVSQKMFDNLLFVSLSKIKSRFVIIEDESKRIGNIHLPEKLFNKIKEGLRIEVNTSLENRINIIMEEYVNNSSKDELKSSLLKISKYIKKEDMIMLLKDIDEGRYKKVIEFLMLNYYDKKYKKLRESDFYIFFKDINFAVNEIKKIFASFCNA